MAVKMVPECSYCHETVFRGQLDSDQPISDLLLLVTKCNHVFEKACLEDCLAKKKECPLDHETINNHLECRPIEHILEVFGKLYKKDPVFVMRRLQEMLKDDPGGTCSICLKEFLPIFLISDHELMHQACWEKNNPKIQTHPISLVPQQIATITQKGIQTHPDLANLLPALPSSALAGLPNPGSSSGKSPASSPRKSSLSISPVLVVVGAIAPIISLWAFAMNTRIYRNQNPLLFVLSIPVLLIVKIFSALRFTLKRMFA